MRSILRAQLIGASSGTPPVIECALRHSSKFLLRSCLLLSSCDFPYLHTSVSVAPPLRSRPHRSILLLLVRKRDSSEPNASFVSHHLHIIVSDMGTKRKASGDDGSPRPAKKSSATVSEYPSTGIDGEGEQYIALSKMRRVGISTYNGQTLVSMREYYEKDGKMMPTKKVRWCPP